MEEMKICSKCNERFPLTDEYFEPRKKGKDGFRNQCRKCRNMKWKPKQEPCEEGMKRCNKCGEILLLTREYFEPRTKSKDGYRNQCRKCRNKIKPKRELKSKQIEYDGYTFTKDNKTGYYLSAKPIYNNKRIMLHRYIWIKYNGEIQEDLVVHHIDGDKENNDISNFALMSNYEHSKMHGDETADERREAMLKRLSTKTFKKAKVKQTLWRESEEGKRFYVEQAKRIKESGIYDRTETLICQYCGKEFKTTKLCADKTKFCSGKCADKARSESGIDDIERECVICGTKFIINKRKVRQTCSEQCKFILRNRTRTLAL